MNKFTQQCCGINLFGLLLDQWDTIQQQEAEEKYQTLGLVIRAPKDRGPKNAKNAKITTPKLSKVKTCSNKTTLVQGAWMQRRQIKQQGKMKKVNWNYKSTVWILFEALSNPSRGVIVRGPSGVDSSGRSTSNTRYW